VGSDVAVPVGARGVSVAVSVGAGVSVGNGEGTKGVEVGNGVKVGKLKLNKGVGLASAPAVGNRLGFGAGVGELREESKLARTEQRQQNISTNKAGRSIFPNCPCRS